MAKKTEIINARIVRADLGIEDHGLLSFQLMFEWPGAGCAWGGVRLDGMGGKSGYTGALIRAILETVGVLDWSELKGSVARIESEGWGGGIVRIGNLLEDRWLNLDEFYKNFE